MARLVDPCGSKKAQCVNGACAVAPQIKRCRLAALIAAVAAGACSTGGGELTGAGGKPGTGGTGGPPPSTVVTFELAQQQRAGASIYSRSAWIES